MLKVNDWTTDIIGNKIIKVLKEERFKWEIMKIENQFGLS